MFKSWTFEHKRPEEKIVSTFKRHPIVLLKGLFISLVLIIAMILLFYFLGFKSITIIVSVLIFIIIFLVNSYYLYLWRNDLYVLTNERLIDVDQHGLFNRIVTETALDQIQEVKVIVKGPLENIFGYGTVIVQTAGPSDNIVLEVTPKPFQTQRLINKAFHEYRQLIGHIQNNKGNQNE